MNKFQIIPLAWDSVQYDFFSRLKRPTIGRLHRFPMIQTLCYLETRVLIIGPSFMDDFFVSTIPPIDL